MATPEEITTRLDRQAEQDFKRQARELLARVPEPFGVEGRQAYFALRRILLGNDEGAP